MQNHINELINRLDPTKVQCTKCSKWLNQKQLITYMPCIHYCFKCFNKDFDQTITEIELQKLLRKK